MTVDFRLDDEAAVRANVYPLLGQRHLAPRSLLVLFADSEAAAIMAVAVDDVPPDPPRVDRVRTLGPLVRRLRDHLGADGALLIISRPGSPDVGAGDLAWRDAFAGATQTAHLVYHGVYVVTTAGVAVLRAGALDAA